MGHLSRQQKQKEYVLLLIAPRASSAMNSCYTSLTDARYRTTLQYCLGPTSGGMQAVICAATDDPGLQPAVKCSPTYEECCICVTMIPIKVHSHIYIYYVPIFQGPAVQNSHAAAVVRRPSSALPAYGRPLWWTEQLDSILSSSSALTAAGSVIVLEVTAKAALISRTCCQECHDTPPHSQRCKCSWESRGS